MATPASKNSTTPPFTRHKPNARSSELNDPLRRSSELNPMRRSFTGNPFGDKPSVVPHPRGFIPNTPVNSPSEFPPRRHSMGRERLASYEDKENGKDQNPKGRYRSPAPSKGTKNFMSPTISAASKITVSPRKKVLSERNEQVRSSISFADVRHLIVEDSETTTPVMTMKQNKSGDFSDSLVMECDVDVVDGAGLVSRSFTDDKDFVNVDPSFNISPPCPPLAPPLDAAPTLAVSRSFTDDKDFVNVDPSFNISPPCPPLAPPLDAAPTLAPLDADPLMPPYDPKTNYLSPRPQFLHYRPNPRIEHFRESGGVQLEDSFESESSSEVEFTEEETLSDDSQREEVSYSEMVKEEEDSEEDVDVSESEPNPVKLDVNEKIFEVKTVPKKHFFGRKSLMTLVLLLAVALFSFSATNSPIFAPPMFDGLDLSNIQVPFDEVRDSVKAYFDVFSENVCYWSSNSLSRISKMISRLSGVQEFSPLPYANLSSLLEDQTSDGHLVFAQVVFEPIEKREEVGIEAEANAYQIDEEPEEEEEDDESEPLCVDQADDEVGDHENSEVVLEVETVEYEAVHQQIESEMIEGVASEVQTIENEAVHQQNEPEMIEAVALEVETKENEAVHQQIESEVIEPDHIVEDIAVAADTGINLENSVKLEDQQGIKTSNDIQPAESKIEEPEAENPSEMELQSETENSGAVSAWNTIKDSVSKLPTHSLLGVALLLLCLLASVPLIKRKKSQPSVQEAATNLVQAEQPLLSKKHDHDAAASVSMDHTSREQFSSRNWQTQVDMVHDYCPSEMSSYGKSASYSTKKVLDGNSSEEAQSQETKPKKQYRRESLASSDCSMGSFSYGSFTTYEKLPKKHGDKEIVTPVRRSSRIRKTETK